MTCNWHLLEPVDYLATILHENAAQARRPGSQDIDSKQQTSEHCVRGSTAVTAGAPLGREDAHDSENPAFDCQRWSKETRRGRPMPDWRRWQRIQARPCGERSPAHAWRFFDRSATALDGNV